MIRPGDAGYDGLLAHWEGSNRPGQIENLAEGWLMRVYFPEPGSGPVFVEECSADDYAIAVGTKTSWQRKP